MTPITIKGADYQAGKLAPFPAFHITRRLLPVLSKMGVSPSELAAMATPQEKTNLPGAAAPGPDAPSELAAAAAQKETDLLSVVAPALEFIAQMPNDDVDYVLQECMRVCTRKQGDLWAPIMAPRGGFMFPDIDMMVMVRLAMGVLKENMTEFFVSPPDAVKP